MEFEYTPTNIPGPGCDQSDFTTELPGCECTSEKCIDSNDCICLRYGQNYDPITGDLLEFSDDAGPDRPVFECGSACQCGPDCGNRKVQFGIQVPLDVFSTENKGYGLRTLSSLHRGQFVCEYAGEIIDLTEASRRISSLPDGSPNYIFVLREHSVSTSSDQPTVITTCIDPTHKGNLGRFINHSCQPNLTIVPIRYENPVVHLGLFANRQIDQEEELSYDYAGGDQGHVTLSTKECLCGAAGCRGFLPLDKQLFSDQ